MTRILAPLAALGLLTLPALADDVFTDDVIIQNNLCVGDGCIDGEGFGLEYLKIKTNVPWIVLEDITTLPGNPNDDWRITPNDINSLGIEKFSIDNLTRGTTPFTIEAAASTHSLYVEGDGDVGLGTMMPMGNLHISSVSQSEIVLETSLTSSKMYTLANSLGDFLISNGNANPFYITEGAPDSAFFVAGDGDIGLGVQPEGKFHTRGNGVQLAYFESGDGGPVQVRFRTDSENRRFLAVNNANEVKSQIIFLDDRINFTGQTDSGANLWLSIGPDGIVSQGPTCGSPCDLTFDPEHFTVPPIAEHAEYMWDNMHLPAIGPTNSETPINLTEKTGGIIHELEVAHIYIEQLHERLAIQEAELGRLHELEERLARLEAQSE